MCTYSIYSCFDNQFFVCSQIVKIELLGFVVLQGGSGRSRLPNHLTVLAGINAEKLHWYAFPKEVQVDYLRRLVTYHVFIALFSIE